MPEERGKGNYRKVSTPDTSISAENSQRAFAVGKRTFAALSHPNYRLLWLGTVVSGTGDWMDQVALNWLILVLTESPFYLGLLNLTRAVPILILTLFAGVAADRFERRRLMMVTQAIAMVLALILATLVMTETITVWQILLIGTLRGMVLSFNEPARLSLVSDTVPRESLMNAIALNSATFNLTRVIGPALGGVMIGLIGVAGVFYINAASFIAVLWALYAMEFPQRTLRGVQAHIWESFLDGLRYIRRNETISLLIMMTVIPTLLGMQYIAMLTVFAKDVLEIGAAGLGLLTSTAAIGAVIGALGVASLGTFRYKGQLMLISLMVFGIGLLLFSQSTSPVLSMILLLGIGVGQTGYNATNNTLLQSHAAEEYRGRVLSTLSLNRGLVPVGTMIAGTLATFWGAPMAEAAMGLTICFLALIVALRVPSMRRLE